MLLKDDKKLMNILDSYIDSLEYNILYYTLKRKNKKGKYITYKNLDEAMKQREGKEKVFCYISNLGFMELTKSALDIDNFPKRIEETEVGNVIIYTVAWRNSKNNNCFDEDLYDDFEEAYRAIKDHKESFPDGALDYLELYVSIKFACNRAKSFLLTSTLPKKQ